MIKNARSNTWVLLLLGLVNAFPASGAEQTVELPARSIPVLYDVDVVVIGGGLSGVGAAVGAARSGAKTLLIERTGYLGGWLRGTSLGNAFAVPGWRPALCEGVLKDISQKVVDLHMEGYPDLDTVLERGNIVVANHEVLPQAFQQLVKESGADLLYFANYTESITDGTRIKAVIVSTPVGAYAVRGKTFVDCTGLATVAAESGSPTKKAEAFMGFKSIVTGIDDERFQAWAKTRPEEGSSELKQWLEGKLGYELTRFSSEGGPDNMPYPWDDWWTRNSGMYGDLLRAAVDKGELPLYDTIGDRGIISLMEGLKVRTFETTGTIALPSTYIVGVDPIDPIQLSEAHEKSARLMFQFVEFLRRYVPGFENAQLTRNPEMTLNRAGRSIDNPVNPSKEDVEPDAGTSFENDDVIVVSQRGAGSGTYQVPYRAMLPEGVDNLLVVDKSSSGGIRFRTHMLTTLMGQAAGTAAAIAAKQDLPVSDIPIFQLQADLRKAGFLIPDKASTASK